MVDVDGMKEIAERLLVTGEKIDGVVGGTTTYEIAPGNTSIVDGLFALTNDRVLIVKNNITQSFTYSQTNGIWMSEDKSHLTLQTRGEEFRLREVDPESAEKFFKEFNNRKNPPPKTTAATATTVATIDIVVKK